MQTTSGSINAVIGNTALQINAMLAVDADQQTQIQQHLKFVHDFLEQRSDLHLSHQQLRNRQQALSLLYAYTQAGQFPTHNQKVAQRTPRFIDHRGVPCAVAQLLQQTGSSKLAETVNDQFEYAQVAQIDNQELQHWAEAHGLSLLECALIQPQYLPPISELCPILMLARDTPMEQKLSLVREFRDTKLRKAAGGRWVVKCYYKSGPTMVTFLQAHQWSRAPARKLLAMIIEVLDAQKQNS